MTKKHINSQIEKIKKQLVENYGADKIILFGSAVWDKSKSPSDLDFLVIKKGVENNKNRLLPIYKTIKKEIAADFLVYSPQEYSSLLEMGDPFLSKINSQGKVLYG